MELVAKALDLLDTSVEVKSAALSLIQRAVDEYVVLGIIFYIVMQPVLQLLNGGERRFLHSGFEGVWKVIILLYNILLCLFSFGTFVACCFMFNEIGFDGWFVYDSNSTATGCVHGLYRPGTGFELIAYYFYLSKYVEFLDTVFLIVSNKRIINLHYFHHMFAAADMWILHVANNDSIWIFVFFNSAIHTLMYFYYAATLMQINFGFLKQILTSLQILQLFGGTVLSCLPYYFLNCYKQDPMMTVSFWFSTLVFLFSNFFLSSYCGRRSTSARPSARKDKTQ